MRVVFAAAAKAEELGFDAVFVNDHIIVDGSPRSAPWTNTYDPLIALSFIDAMMASGVASNPR
jgi:alkanesulfonate monooxygenase SsuD/methylene tetrahydromethanopterin reductase-like flavin-dependent oxidoreductase (luciferase family)